MRGFVSRLTAALAALFFLSAAVSCGEDVNNKRLPAYPVDVNLSNIGLWNTYGIGGIGDWAEFIKPDVPSGFPWLASTFTGYGGILLVGVDPSAFGNNGAWAYMPMAFDLACPVEAEADIRVYVDDSRFEAVCPVCESRYTLLSGGGPVAGPAVGYKYGLQVYRCTGTPATGFRITR